MTVSHPLSFLYHPRSVFKWGWAIAGVAALKTLATESTKHLSGVLSKKIQKMSQNTWKYSYLALEFSK
ncbi:hypothetical protein [Peribacillus sp. TH14]|uniref:hypothetical protein n=1 Tax=Peribacillus sp. TH14 TaxID=2798481 RepID=UPI00191437F5|nr:hypothetical protein [Peribacillus sp. TH14]MBK5502703.1 hypothetical protein [Peribacillus sp. TH14]